MNIFLKVFVQILSNYNYFFKSIFKIFIGNKLNTSIDVFAYKNLSNKIGGLESHKLTFEENAIYYTLIKIKLSRYFT